MLVAGHRAEFLYWGFFDTTWWRNYPHIHSFYEVCYAYAGHGTFRNGSHAYSVGAGDVFVALPGDVHDIVSSTSEPLGIIFWAYTLVRAPGPATGAADDALLELFGASETHRVSRRSGRIPELLGLLGEEARTRGPGHAAMARSLAAAIVVESARSVVDPAPGAADAGDVREADSHNRVVVETITRYLRDNYHRRVTVRDVAAQVHLSARHAARLFSRSTRMSIHTYLAGIRMRVAAQRLLERQASIKEIAHACGYPDVRHFTTAFRGHWGTPPASFRSQHGTRFLPNEQREPSTEG